MAAYPTRRDDPLAEKKRKVDVWSEEEEVWSPDPSAWVYHDHSAKMEQARRDEESAPRSVKIPTLDYFKPPTRFHTAELFSVRESGSEAVLSAAKFLLGVSSSLVGEPLRRCSGFWVDWDEEKKTGLVLTTARLIRTKDAPFGVWSGGQEYALNADYDNGGLVIDSNGKVVGMVNDPERFGSFIPSSILLNCLDSWKKYRYIARPHLGMRFEAIKLLEPAQVDMLWRMYNIDDGLVVREVSKGSNAEICGIQKGDLIECIKGKCISTTIQLENLLMSICKGPSDSKNGHNAEVRISVGVFQTLKKCRRTVELTATVSDLGEVIARGSKTIS